MAIKLGQFANGAALQQTIDYVDNNLKDYISYDTVNQKIIFNKPVESNVISNTGDNPTTSPVASEEYVRNQIAQLINGSGSSLDTLKELADALGNDANFSTTMTTALGNKVNQSDVNITNTLGSGVKIATITVGSVTRDIFINIQGTAAANVSVNDGVITVTVPKTQQDSMIPTTGQTQFNLSKTPTTNLVKLLVNGLYYIENKDFTVDRDTKKVTWIKTSSNDGFDFESTDNLLFEYETIDN